jgi:hypothetical protein
MSFTDYSIQSRMRADFLILIEDYAALEVEAKNDRIDKVNPRIYRYLLCL